MPCGLILNELISNALKHAFPESRSGEIWIEMRMAEDRQVNLVVADNGTGLSPDLDPLNATSLGLQLVKTLVNQLCGELRFENTHGTRIDTKIIYLTASTDPNTHRRADETQPAGYLSKPFDDEILKITVENAIIG